MAGKVDSDQVEGKARGGKARAAALSADERRTIARQGARARWEGVKTPRAMHEGVVRIGAAEIPCYVLENGHRMLSTRGIMKALGRAWRGRKYTGTELPVFLEAKNLKPFINNDLSPVLTAIEIRTPRGAISEAFKAEILPAVCDIYLQARHGGALTDAQAPVAMQCEILVRALAGVGIIALVDEATGYQHIRPQDALQAYLEKVISRELAAWAKRFPDEFYENIYKLKGWPWPGMAKNRYSVVGTYTTDLVYDRIGPGVTKELEARSPKDERGNRKNKLHQWLTDDIGHPMLAQHMHALVMFQRLALASGFGWNRFVKMVDQAMPRRGETMELPLSEE